VHLAGANNRFTGIGPPSPARLPDPRAAAPHLQP